MDYAYARISRPTQSIERQIRNIRIIKPNAKIYQESYTGTTLERKELDKLLKQVKPNDCITFDSVSRMSRNADEGCELYERLFLQGINLVFIKEPHINTEVYKEAIQKQIDIKVNTGSEATDTFINAILDALNEYSIALAKQQIRLAFEQAEKEVEDLHQRTKEGIESVKIKNQEYIKNGEFEKVKQIGQKTGAKLNVKKEKTAKEKILKLNKDFGGNFNNKETWEMIGISKMTFYKYKKELEK